MQFLCWTHRILTCNALVCLVCYDQIHMKAPAQRVWQVLTDFAAYPEWNPFIRRVNGRPEVEE
jgi:uncharacterized membrane protein